ncbi:MAG: hypothetical protein FWF50_04535 [Defluviitaleaceae bacterium]|nr:hypothetical protein [Defluviitaleaceae bacterium]
MQSVLIAAIIFFPLVFTFLYSYKANRRMPVPEGCDTLHDHSCSACSSKGGCQMAMRTAHLNKEEEEE